MNEVTTLTHADDEGRARMVDVSNKEMTLRMAKATGTIGMAASTLEAIRNNSIEKGDVLSVARIAGIMAAKQTSDLIPLCHTVALTNITIDFNLDVSIPGVRVDAEARTLDRTGIEMEALTAVTIALLTIYDMAKAIDRGMTIGAIELLEKTGGASGDWTRPG